MRRTMTALAATAVLTLTACGSDDEPSTPAPASEAEETPEDTSGGAEQTQIDVDETIEDDVLGHVIKVTGVVRDFEAPDHTNVPDEGGEWVLVEVDVKAGEKYSGRVNAFKLLADGELAGSKTTVIDSAVEDAGFELYEDASRGESSKGWLVFQVNSRSDAYQLEYKRPAATVIGGGDPIEERIWTVDLPTS